MTEPARSPDHSHDATARRLYPPGSSLMSDGEIGAQHCLGMCADWAGHPACDGEHGLQQFLMDCADGLRWQRDEIGRLRTIVRVNALRAGATDAEIDEVLNGR